ncbi:MAG: PAS domain-containing protein [Candidatus Fermentibacteraceae bacterium]
MADFTRTNTLLGVLETISEPVISYSAALRIVWMNPAAEVFLGLSLERVRGLSCLDIFSEDLPCRNNCPVRRALKEDRTVSLLTEGLASGETLLTAVPFIQGGGLARVLEIIQGEFMEISKPPFKFRFLEQVNGTFDLAEAAPVLVEATREIAGEVAVGVYSLCDAGFSLISGSAVPESMKALPGLEFVSRSALYVLTSSIFPGIPSEGLPLEVSLLPLHGSKRPAALLLCGVIPDSDGRERLEELQSVMNAAMDRFHRAEECERLLI